MRFLTDVVLTNALQSRLRMSDLLVIPTPHNCPVCGTKSTLRCSNCHLTFYCDRKHQKEHWPEHKKVCRPFKVAQNDVMGRYLIATRDIQAGEVMLKEKPIIAGPSQITGPVCLGCLRELRRDKFVECGKCGWPMCDAKCLAASDHRLECDMTVQKGNGKVSIKDFVSPHPMYQCILTMRCMQLRDMEPKRWHRLNELESHSELRKDTAQWKVDRDAIAKFILRYYQPKDWTEDEILRLIGIAQINGHEVPITEPPNIR